MASLRKIKHNLAICKTLEDLDNYFLLYPQIFFLEKGCIFLTILYKNIYIATYDRRCHRYSFLDLRLFFILLYRKRFIVGQVKAVDRFQQNTYRLSKDFIQACHFKHLSICISIKDLFLSI